MNPATKPIILVVDYDAGASDTVERLVARYSHDYTIVADPDVVSASQRMRALAESASDLALILADRASNGAMLLEEAGYILVEKRFQDRKPQTRYQATEAGRAAFRDHLGALEAILRGST